MPLLPLPVLPAVPAEEPAEVDVPSPDDDAAPLDAAEEALPVVPPEVALSVPAEPDEALLDPALEVPVLGPAPPHAARTAAQTPRRWGSAREILIAPVCPSGTPLALASAVWRVRAGRSPGNDWRFRPTVRKRVEFAPGTADAPATFAREGRYPVMHLLTPHSRAFITDLVDSAVTRPFLEDLLRLRAIRRVLPQLDDDAPALTRPADDRRAA